MTYEEFMKGITILYAFGLAEKDDWELKIWFRALQFEIEPEEYEKACIHLCKNNPKFWETDNIPAQLLEVIESQEIERKSLASKERLLLDQKRRDQQIQEAKDSYDSEEDRLKCIEEFKRMNREVFKGFPG